MVAETKKAHEVQWYGSTLFETDDVLLADRYAHLCKRQGKKKIEVIHNEQEDI